jgi:hypothetical protein
MKEYDKFVSKYKTDEGYNVIEVKKFDEKRKNERNIFIISHYIVNRKCVEENCMMLNKNDLLKILKMIE